MNRRAFLRILGTILPVLGTACSIYPEHHRRKPLCDPGEHDTKEKPCREWAMGFDPANGRDSGATVVFRIGRDGIMKIVGELAPSKHSAKVIR